MPVDAELAAKMTPERLEVSRAWGLASAIPFTKPPDDDPREREGIPDPPQAAPRPQLVGLTLTGRDWLVMQLPGGTVRCVGDEMTCRDEARRLAMSESGEFGTFQPRGISRPQTTVTDELL